MGAQLRGQLPDVLQHLRGRHDRAERQLQPRRDEGGNRSQDLEFRQQHHVLVVDPGREDEERKIDNILKLFSSIGRKVGFKILTIKSKSISGPDSLV